MEIPQKSAITQESKLHFLDYWRIIRIRKTIILSVFLLILLTAIAVTFYLPKAYAGIARMKVEKDTPDISLLGGAGLQQQYDPYWLLTEFEVIRSPKILEPVIEIMKLNEDYARRFKSENPFTISDTFPLLSRDVEVNQYRNTSVLEVKAFHPSAEMSAQIANAIVREYQEYRSESRNSRSRRGLSALTNELAQLKIEVFNARAHVDKLGKELKVSDIIRDSASVQTLDATRMTHLEQLKTEAEASLAANQEMLAQMATKTGDALVDFLAASSATAELTSLIGKRNDGRQAVSILLADHGENHPSVKRILDGLRTVEIQINAQVTAIIEARKTLVAKDRATADKISSSLVEAIDKSASENARIGPYITAKRDLESKEVLFRALTGKKWQEQLDSQISKSSSVEVIAEAKPAKRAVKPNTALNIALGTLIGLLVGVGLAFFIEYLDTSVKTIDDVEQALQAPVLGVIPQNVGTLLNEGADSPHAEAYRVLRTNVLFSRKDPNLRTMTVVSGGAGEGKSTTIFNLATIFAQQGSRVLVVDSDLRRPSLHKIMNVSNTIGLTNYLLNQNKLEEVVQTTKLASLDFLPSGKLPSSSMGILNSVRMKEFIQEVKSRYDFVFFDSPPIMGVSDASVLASEVDMAILVVQYRKYPQQMTLRAKQMVEKVGGRLLGVVLNNINISQDSYYYYYSGYYYDYYSKNDDSKPSNEKKGGSGKGADPAKPALDLKQKF